VVNAWRREHGEVPAEIARPAPGDAPRRELANPRDVALVERLRVWRRETAMSAGVAAFVVLPDAALVEIAASRPRSPQALLALRGLGPAKVEKYGQAVLNLVAADEP
jgi:DNA helicase-2/ATP-dependent DNA helicase PcrA